MITTSEPLNFDCPRCSEPVKERFYGPCAPCREELTAQLVGEAHEVQTERYEPKMNVTPNQVATKE